MQLAGVHRAGNRYLFLVLLIVLPLFPRLVDAQTPGPASERVDRISIELWSIDDTIIHGESLPEERFLQEARFTISSILYGWSFRYVPGSRARGVVQEFEIEESASIARADPALTVRDVDRADNTFFGVVDYEVSSEDRRRREARERISTVRSEGIGRSDLLNGIDGKLEAIENAVRDAIDRHLRDTIPNRPREVWGDVTLAEAPQIRPVAGQYEARVQILLRIEAVRPYLTY